MSSADYVRGAPTFATVLLFFPRQAGSYECLRLQQDTGIQLGYVCSQKNCLLGPDT